MRKTYLIAGYTFNIMAALFSQPAHADEWAALPFYSNTALFATGAGLNPLGEKVGPCLEAGKRIITPNGNYRFAISMADTSKSSAYSENTTNVMTFEGGARFGVAGGGMKYESLKKNTQEISADDRSVNIYLEAISEISNEVGYDYALTDTGKKFLLKSRTSFTDNCGVLIATEQSRIVAVRASITIQFSSLEQKKSFMNKTALSADGNYGPYSAKLSVMNQLDSTLTQNQSAFRFNASIEAKGETGLTGLSEYTKRLQDLKSEPFKHSLEALSAVLNAYKGDKGAINKIRFVPVETLVPEADLASWPTRANFWQTASSLYDTLALFESINQLRFGENDPAIRRFVPTLITKTCSGETSVSNGAMSNDRFCIPYFLNKGSSTNLTRMKQNLRSLISLCLSASETNSPFCDTSSLIIITAPLLRQYYSDKFYASSIPDIFDSYSNGSKVFGGDQETPEQKIAFNDNVFIRWIYQLPDGEATSWNVKDFKKATKILADAYTLIPKDLLVTFSNDVKNVSHALFDYDIRAYAFDRDSNTEQILRLNYKKGSIALRTSGPAEVESFLFILPSGRALSIKMGYKSIFNDTDVMYWWGDGKECDPACKPYSSVVSDFLHEAHETKGELYIYAQTVSGMKIKHVASLTL